MPPQISLLKSILTVAPGSNFPLFITVSFVFDCTSSASLCSGTPFLVFHATSTYILLKGGKRLKFGSVLKADIDSKYSSSRVYVQKLLSPAILHVDYPKIDLSVGHLKWQTFKL